MSATPTDDALIVALDFEGLTLAAPSSSSGLIIIKYQVLTAWSDPHKRICFSSYSTLRYPIW